MLYHLFLWNIEELSTLSKSERISRINKAVNKFRQQDNVSIRWRYFLVFVLALIPASIIAVMHSVFLGGSLLVLGMLTLESFLVKSEIPFIKAMITGQEIDNLS